MKRLNILTLALAGMMAFTACEDSLDPVYHSDKAVGASLKSIDAEYTLAKADEEKTFADFTFQAGDYGLQMASQYTLQIATAGTEFADAAALGKTSEILADGTGVISVTTAKINAALKNLGAAEKELYAVDLRVVMEAMNGSVVVSGVAPVYSNVISSSIAPYPAKRTFNYLNLPGGYQGFWGGGSWDAAGTDQVIYSKNNNTEYEGYIYFPEATEFKIAQGSWDVNWGLTDGKMVQDGGNINITDPGFYLIRFNTADDASFVCKKVDLVVAGSALGDASPVALEYDHSNKVYRATVTLKAGEFTFNAAAADETLVLGASTESGAEPRDLMYNGAAISNDAAGTYTFALDLNSGIYSYKLYSGTILCDYPVLNMPGTANEWNAATLTPAIVSLKSDGNYEGYVYYAEAGDFKFAKGSWDENWGSSDLAALVAGGDNIHYEDAGVYKVFANPETLKMSMVKTEWSVIGSAATNWDTDDAMTWNPETKKFEITMAMNAGEFKFRANNAWTYEVADPETGGNIIIEEAGTYLISLDLLTDISGAHFAPSYTITKQ